MIIRERTGVVVLLGAVALAVAVAFIFRDVVRGPGDPVPWDHAWVERDLEAIAADTLRVLVLRDPLSWEERPKAETGLEYELLERFAKREGMPIAALPVDHPDTMLLYLQQGKGDVIAAQYTPRRRHRRWLAVTEPYHRVRPMVAVLREDPVLTTNVLGPAMDTLYMSVWSPFMGSAHGQVGNAPIRAVERSPEDCFLDVVLGGRSNTVLPDALAAYEAHLFPTIEFSAIEGQEKPLVFALRKNAKDLQERLDAWLSDPAEKDFRNELIGTYVKALPKPGALRKRSMPVSRDSISPYDEEFRIHGSGFGWRWQLLAAMAWKESRFDSSAVSSQGAMGIMQIMPRTATKLGLDSSVTVGAHIEAAKRYVSRLDTMWMRAVPDREQRLRFVLASYNAGPGHVIDAQRLAERIGLDPQQWEHHVERAILLLALPRYYTRPEMKNGYCKGSQVFHYVRDITSLYDQLSGSHNAKPKAAITAAE
jgi:membrane-bound lytic murein transglycosylase F